MKKVSTVITVYNAEKFIHSAISQQLEQTYLSHEIIVVNDGSTDGSLEIISSFCDKVKIVTTENRGVAAARNVGIENASGSFLNFPDPDDVCPINRIEKMIESINDHDVAIGKVEEFFDCHEIVISQRRAAQGQYPALLCGGALFRAEVFEKHGKFREEFKLAEYMEFYMRIRDQGAKIVMFDDLVIQRRIHDHNWSYLKKDLMAKEYPKVIAESLNRKKQRATAQD